MLTIKAIKENQNIRDCLNREITPEKAVALYQEWGSSCPHGRDFVRCGSDASGFFTLDAWEKPAKPLLLRQSTAEGEIIGEVIAPRELMEKELQAWGGRRGNYGISEDLKDWLRNELALS